MEMHVRRQAGQDAARARQCRRHTRWLRWLLMAVASLGISVAPAVAQDGRPIPKSYMNKNLVHLPIQIEAGARGQIREVQLYVKDNPQAAWTIKERAPGTQAYFSFKAPQDGEYWFNVVTVDKNGRHLPADVNSEPPALIVVIDTTPPQAEVRVLGDTPEGTRVHCEVRDANTDLVKTRLFFQTRDQVWRPLEPVPGHSDVYCIPVQAAFTGMVRVVASDLAGNVASRELNIGVPTPTTAQAVLPTPSAKPGNNVIVVDHPLDKTGAPNEIIIDKVPYAPPQTTKTPQPFPIPDKALPIQERVEIVSAKPAMPAAPTTGAAANVPPAFSPPPPPTIQNVGPMLEPTPFKGGPAIVPAPEKPAVYEKPAVPEKTPPTPVIPAVVTNMAPTNVTPVPSTPEPPAYRHLVNGTRVFLEYQIEQAGASGVGKVEIWLTRDAGQTWQKLGEDLDRKSPAEVTLPGEGLFGVSLVVANGRGFGAMPPKAGDAPEWWIEVDATKPKAELLNVRSGQSDDGSLEISWSAKDKNLTDDAVDLFFATERQGPWQSIAKGLKNDGVYRWTPGPNAGSHAFIRLVVRDMAGNVTTTESAQPVALDDLSRPRGRVVGISTAPRTMPPTPYGN